jgi:hypothetical protein
MSNANTVILKQGCQRGEGKAGGTITPGHLIKLNSSGTLVVHSTASGIAQKRFAIENELYGKGITDNYSSGDRVQYFIGRTGDHVLARLKASENIHIGDPLVSAGNGTLMLATDVSAPSTVEYPECIIGYAGEASNSSSVALIDIEVA